MKRIALLALAVLAAALALAPPSRAVEPVTWHRAALVYLDPQRDAGGWERHLMAVDPAGNFTGQWLFDALVLTTDEVNGHRLAYDALSGQDLTDLLDRLFAAAAEVDEAASALSGAHPPPAAPIGVSFALPWMDPAQHALTLPGRSRPLDLSDPDDRAAAADWYEDQLVGRAEAAHWRHLTLSGVYYAREDTIDATGDAGFVKRLNADAHARDLATVWAPYFGAANAWNGRDLGFDVVNVQPSYAFRSAQYGGDVDGDRLYAVAGESVAHREAFEYEVSSGGDTAPESWIARQYLAIGQETGASNYPQLFFVGLQGDLFDQIGTGASASRWATYQDLTAYLGNAAVANLETRMPWAPRVAPDGTLTQASWSPGAGRVPTAVRLDFSDPNPADPWRGRLRAEVHWADGTLTAFGQRAGAGELAGYDSLTVPLPAAPTPGEPITGITLSMTREDGSPWPTVQRVVAIRYALPNVAGSTSGEQSNSTTMVQQGPYPDSAPSDSMFAAGKLTDGQVSPTGSWYWTGTMGWNFYEGRFRVSIDLGRSVPVASVVLTAHFGPSAAINWPLEVAADVGTGCPPRDSGILGRSCLAAGTSGRATLSSTPVQGDPAQSTGTVALPLADVSGRYVTVTGTGTGWVLLDEITVTDQTGAVVSTGRPYTVSPMPSVEQGKETPGGDDTAKLTDGTVIPDYGPQYAQQLVAVPAATGGYAQTFWLTPQPIGSATLWLTNAEPNEGVLVPDTATFLWRDQDARWHQLPPAKPAVVPWPAPYIKVDLPAGAMVTGIYVQLPAAPGVSGSYMLSELDTQ